VKRAERKTPVLISSPVICLILEKYVNSQQELFEEHTACYGEFKGEEIGMGGELRTAAMKTYDYQSTHLRGSG
jgi:hypothetical protein